MERSQRVPVVGVHALVRGEGVLACLIEVVVSTEIRSYVVGVLVVDQVVAARTHQGNRLVRGTEVVHDARLQRIALSQGERATGDAVSAAARVAHCCY